MARTIPLDPLSPVAALAEAVGLTPYALAKARGVTPQTVQAHVRRGAGIGLDTLAALAEAVGYRLSLRIEKIDTGD